MLITLILFTCVVYPFLLHNQGKYIRSSNNHDNKYLWCSLMSYFLWEEGKRWKGNIL